MSRVPDRPLDVVCLGRAAVDLYGQQVGGRLEDMQSFAKYLGGSSANLAAGLARMGARSAMLTRVGDEQMGRFVREELARQGVDVSQMRTDPTRLTALVILGIGAADDIPHIFFREHCADMGVVADDVDEDFIASATLFAVTGTHLSTESTREAVRTAIAFAKKHGTKVALDIDYRPVLWGLGSAGEGASRFVESAATSEILQEFLPDCDLVIGTEEEVAIAGGSTDLLEALQGIRRKSAAAIVLKRGASGCAVFDTDSISSLDDGVTCPGMEVEVFNTVGAGDAFLAGFLSAWLDGESWERCGRVGNACGALVVARHGCTPAMPTRPELEHFLALDAPPRQPRLDAGISHLHRATSWRDDSRPLCVLAFDHRSQFEELAATHGRSTADITRFKHLVADVFLEIATAGGSTVRHGAIVDHRYGESVLARLAASDIWTASPVEIPGSRPLEFETYFGFGQVLATWPVNQVVKCLLFYHPDDAEGLRHRQEERIRAMYADIVALERRLILEVICPDIGGGRPAALPRAMRRIYNLGIRPDWWKLEAQSKEGWQAVNDVIRDCDPYCKGVVILGLGADREELQRGLEVAAEFDICRGFAVGRSIFAEAAEGWFGGSADDDAVRSSVRSNYQTLIDTWNGATPVGKATGRNRYA